MDSYVEDNFEQVVAAFNDCGLDGELGDGVYKDCFSLSLVLYDAAKRAGKDGSEARKKVLQLLADACSLRLAPDNLSEPFHPMSVMRGRRSTILNDFTDSEIAVFARIVGNVDFPLLRARLADLVWIRQRPRDVEFALIAIDSYTELPLDADRWSYGQESGWLRAIFLSRMIGEAAEDRLNLIESQIVGTLQSAPKEPSFFILRLADSLISNGLGEDHSTMIATRLELFAREFEEDEDFHTSEAFYHASVMWFKYSGDEDKSLDMTVAKAETKVKEAFARVQSNSPSYSVAASFLEEAVQVYRSIPRVHRGRYDVDQRLKEIRARLEEYGKQALDAMMTLEGSSIDLTNSVEQARDAVRGKSSVEALMAFANLYSVSVKQLRESAKDALAAHPLLASIPKYVTSHDGRVIARTPGISGSTPSEDDEVEIRSQMNRMHYLPEVSVAVQGLILPALEVLNLEHHLRAADFTHFARRASIVPIGREGLFGRALSQGYDWDFVTSIHLLTPQIEHMVRFHLKVAGAITTHLDAQGIENEKGLSALIDLPETSAIFGEDLTYEIKTLFCDQMGPNLRNNTAHGLLDDQQCQTVDAVYAWWLGLKLVFSSFWNSLTIDSRDNKD